MKRILDDTHIVGHPSCTLLAVPRRCCPTSNTGCLLAALATLDDNWAICLSPCHAQQLCTDCAIDAETPWTNSAAEMMRMSLSHRVHPVIRSTHPAIGQIRWRESLDEIRLSC